MILLAIALTAKGSSDASSSTAAASEAASPQLQAELADCQERGQTVSFEAFSAGGDPLGLPLTATLRRCDLTTDGAEPGADYVSYIYGECEYRDPNRPEGGCEPPLEVQTWPACDRSLADYMLEGKPYPHEALPDERGAQVAAFEEGSRLELYSGTSTVVIFANDPSVAMKALALLRPQGPSTAPAARSSELETELPQKLAPPADGAVEGRLGCAG